jgi:hypothetical protein
MKTDRRFFAKLIRAVVALAIVGAAQQVLAQQGMAQQVLAQQVELEGPERGNLRALVIGIDAYKNVRPLLGAIADARDIEGALRRGGVSDVTALLDEGATRDAVIAALEALTRRAVRGDVVILSIAGHGAQEPERVKGSQPDGMDTIFLLTNFARSVAGSRERIVGTEFNHFIRKLEEKGAEVLFIADTCHGGGMARDVDPRAGELSFRQVPAYQIPNDALVPVSTASDAFLTEADFERSAFLAAVDRKTKAPEILIPGVTGHRGALSYAVARALEGLADANADRMVTLKELFGYVRQVVYQLSDQRQNPVTVSSPHRDVEREVAFGLSRGVRVVDAPDTKPTATAPSIAAVSPPPALASAASAPKVMTPAPIAEPVRVAALDGKTTWFDGLTPREAAFEVVAPSRGPDLVWDAASGDLLAGADVIAFRLEKSELPSAIDRAAAVRALKTMAAQWPQAIRVLPDDSLRREGSRAFVEIANLQGRALILLNIAGDGTVQMLYPTRPDAKPVREPEFRLPVQVRRPYGADLVIAISSDQPLPQLEQSLRALNQRRSAVEALRLVERYRSSSLRIGAAGIFTAP